MQVLKSSKDFSNNFGRLKLIQFTLGLYFLKKSPLFW